MNGLRLKPINPPPDNRAVVLLKKVDYLDAYSLELAGRKGFDLDRFTFLALGRMPGFVRVPMALRNRLVVGLGIKTAPGENDQPPLIIPVLMRQGGRLLTQKLQSA